MTKLSGGSEKQFTDALRAYIGKPVVAGTRITVELILEKLSAGETAEQILDAHPRLTPEAMALCLSGWQGYRHYAKPK
ncbi:MAG: hypothetical protein DDT20_01288 [Firmicutes bacterium]|nr:hypothetical protein [Bacillota bacterium]